MTKKNLIRFSRNNIILSFLITQVTKQILSLKLCIIIMDRNTDMDMSTIVCESNMNGYIESLCLQIVRVRFLNGIQKEST